MKNVLKLFLLLGVVGTAQAKVSQYHELSFSSNLLNSDGRDFGSGLFNAFSYKANDTWSVGAELATDFGFVVGSDKDFSIAHSVLRFPVGQNLGEFRGWKTRLMYRWTAPTTAGAHQVGGLGGIKVRPAFSREWDRFSLLVRPGVNFALTNQGYQKFVAPGGKQSAVTLFSYDVDVIPSYTINDQFSVGFLAFFAQGYKGGAPYNKNEGFVNPSFYHETSVTYAAPFAELTLAVEHNDADILDDVNGLEFFTKKGTNFVLKVAVSL